MRIALKAVPMESQLATQHNSRNKQEFTVLRPVSSSFVNSSLSPLPNCLSCQLRCVVPGYYSKIKYSMKKKISPTVTALPRLNVARVRNHSCTFRQKVRVIEPDQHCQTSKDRRNEANKPNENKQSNIEGGYITHHLAKPEGNTSYTTLRISQGCGNFKLR